MDAIAGELMRILRKNASTLFAIVWALLCLGGCSSQEDIARQVDSSIYSFDTGRTEQAMASARSISRLDESLSAFLVYQYSLFSSIRDDKDLAAADASLKAWLQARTDSPSKYRGAMIAAKAYALYASADGRTQKYFSDACAKWQGYGEVECAKHLLDDALDAYYAVHYKHGAVYLYEASTVFERVVADKAAGGEFYRALALVEINNSRANSAFRGLIERKQFTVVMAQQYCDFMGGTNYQRILNCNKVRDDLQHRANP